MLRYLISSLLGILLVVASVPRCHWFASLLETRAGTGEAELARPCAEHQAVSPASQDRIEADQACRCTLFKFPLALPIGQLAGTELWIPPRLSWILLSLSLPKQSLPPRAPDPPYPKTWVA